MEENIMFKAMLGNLTEANRMVMALYYGDSYTIREISQILEIYTILSEFVELVKQKAG